MQYQGGKSRIAKQISEVIINEVSRWQNQNSESNCYNNYEFREEADELTLVSLFCGACSVETKLADKFDKVICNDIHKYLIALLKGVSNGYELPNHITEEEYYYVKEHKDDDEVLTGFVGFGSSFGGRWFMGYGRSKNRSHAAESKKALERDNKLLYNAEFICNDYRNVEIPNNSIIYADPPYANTTSYNNDKFNSEEFWEYMRKLSKTHLVFISELNAPDDFVSIWEKPITRTLDRNKNNYFKSTEKLFIHKCNYKENKK